MTAAEAHEKWRAALEIMESLSQEFPCEECDGTGELYPNGCYHPCDECWGRGFSLPDEEEEDE